MCQTRAWLPQHECMKGRLNKIKLHVSHKWLFVLILQNPCLKLLYYRRKAFIDHLNKKKQIPECVMKYLSWELYNFDIYKHKNMFMVMHHPTKLILSICLQDVFYYSERSSSIDFTGFFFQGKEPSIILIFLSYAFWFFFLPCEGLGF